MDVTGPGAGVLLCTPQDRSPVLVLWHAKWRPDQKEPEKRETAAWEGIQQFFIRSSCRTEVRAADEVPADARAFGKVVAITVRELGPVLRIGLPVPVEGGTEVVFESTVLDGRSGKTLAELRTHWQNGGPFVVKGVKTLSEDMASALTATFY